MWMYVDFIAQRPANITKSIKRAYTKTCTTWISLPGSLALQGSGLYVPRTAGVKPFRAQSRAKYVKNASFSSISRRFRGDLDDSAAPLRLEPLISGSVETSLEALPVSDEIAMENATQTTCGKLFMEMWTNDDSGFPFPRGCPSTI